jgi:hypothetical protein
VLLSTVSPAVARTVEPLDPLQVTMDRIAPSTIPAKGRVVVSGEITNTSDVTWSDLKVYLLTSYFPFTNETSVNEALATAPTSYFGRRITEHLVLADDLAPGQSTRFRLRVPRSALRMSFEQGVYWIGVQVLGTGNGGRDDLADGRARTLIPLIREKNPPTTSLGLMLPFRARISYDADGKVVAAGIWRKALSDKGRFGRLVALSRSARSFPVTWVVDAALVDLAQALATDDPGLLIARVDGNGPTPSATPTNKDTGKPELSAEAKTTKAWLDAFGAEAVRRDVLALPYGDVDVAAAYRSSDGELVDEAAKLAATTLRRIDVAGTPVVDPPDGALPWDAVNGISPQTPVVLSETSVAATGPRVDVPNGPRLTLVDAGASTGIPGLASPLTALAMRQRILAEAALHALSANRDEPLVVQLPDRWDPGTGWRNAEFFAGLDVPWLLGTSAASMVRSRVTNQTIEPDSSALLYPEEPEEIPAANLVAARNLINAGRTLDTLLPKNDTIAEQLAGFAYLGTSGQQRNRAFTAAGRTDDLVDTVERLMKKVTVSAPAFVTMSSEDGPFQITVANGLDQPVTVGVRGRAIGTTKLTIPPLPPITIPAGARRSIRMHANSSRIGVWRVVLEPVNADGVALGSSTELRVRSSHVGQYIWAILGIGSLVLVVAIALRVRRKVRARQATHGPVLKRADW